MLGAGPAQLGLLEAAQGARDLDGGLRPRSRRARVRARRPALHRLDRRRAGDRAARGGAPARRRDRARAPTRPVAVAARVAEKLGLPHPISPATAMRRDQQAPPARGARRGRRAAAALAGRLRGRGALELALPRRRQGARPGRAGTAAARRATRPSSPRRSRLRARASRGGAVLVEEYVDGPEVTVSGFSAGGRVRPARRDRPRLGRRRPAFGVPLAQIWPSPHAEAAVEVDAARRRGARDRGRARRTRGCG